MSSYCNEWNAVGFYDSRAATIETTEMSEMSDYLESEKLRTHRARKNERFAKENAYDGFSLRNFSQGTIDPQSVLGQCNRIMRATLKREFTSLGLIPRRKKICDNKNYQKFHAAKIASAQLRISTGDE